MALSVHDFELLLQANRILSSKLDSTDLLEAVMELAAKVVRAEAASILLLDDRTQELYFDVALGEAGEQVKRVRLKVGEGIAGWVAKERKALIVNDVSQDPRWSGKGDKQSDFKTRQILAVPITLMGKLLGVVEAINRVDGTPFTEEDQRAFEAFASQAAVAIENARLFSAVKGEKEKMSLVFSEMSDGALLIDEAGNIQLMNASAGNFFSLPPYEAIGQVNVNHLLQDFYVVPPLAELMSQTQRGLTFEMQRKEGKAFYLLGAFNRLNGENGDLLGYLLILQDVSDLRKEEVLKRNFLSLISHKLKTPLVTILGYAPLLLEGAEPLSDRQKKALTSIRTQSQLLGSLVDKLLSFSTIESENITLDLVPTPPQKLVDEALAPFKPLTAAGQLKLEVGDFTAMPKVHADAERVREALRNLLENAVKFNPRPDRMVSLTGRLEDGFIHFMVRDNGPGIPPEEHRRIFQKFYQIEESFTGQVEGAGLGLALVKRIAEAHGGQALLDSTPGQGSLFAITLPAVT